MKSFQNFSIAITEIIDHIYSLSDKEHQRRIKFVAKLSRVILEGAKTGNFPTDLLDPTRNISARIKDQLAQKDPSEKLQSALTTFAERVDYFADTLKDLTVSEKKAICGLRYLLFLYKIKRVTYRHLATLFIDLNNEGIDMELETFEDVNHLDKAEGPEIFLENYKDDFSEQREETHEFQSAGVLES